MPNGLPARLTSMTFRAQDLQRSDLSIHLDITKGLDEAVEVRGTDTVIPSRAGRTARNRQKDRLGIELSGWVQGVGATEADRLDSYQEAVDFLRNLFDPSDNTGVLAGTAFDTSHRTINARPVSDPLRWGPPPQRLFGVREVIVVLESVDPDWGGGS